MTPSRESIWNQPTEIAYGPTVARVEELYVRWAGPRFQAQATVVAESGAPVVRAFECEVLEGSLPPEARRLPSDAVVIDAVRRFGLGGIAPLIRLLGEESEFEARYEAVEVAASQFSLEVALEEHGRLIVRRPRAQIQQQIREVQRMRDEGQGTSQIERELMRRYGLSKRTAYRRIQAAKAAVKAQGRE